MNPALALLLSPLVCLAQESSQTRPPFVEARWIGFGDPGVDHADSRFAFRKRLELATTPKSGLVRVTADARYMLWVNGRFVGRGQARGFPWAQPYDDYDLAPFLRRGNERGGRQRPQG
jgi:alpha-L-rhamnosidase